VTAVVCVCVCVCAIIKMCDGHYTQFFDVADVDGSGFLTQDELLSAIRKGDDDKIKVI